MTRTVRSAVLLLSLATASNALALDPARTLTQYVHRIWQVQQGLPQASIYAIVQTRDGYLWLGTETGLVKFDGVRFTAVEQLHGVSIADVWVTHLLEDQPGQLWIGTRRDGVIELRSGTVTRYTTHQGLPSDNVQCLLADKRGTIWVCTPNGLAQIAHGTVKALAASNAAGIDVRAASVTASGEVIVGTDAGRVADWDGRAFRDRPLHLGPSSPVQAMLRSSDGQLWIGTSTGLVRLRGDKETRLTRADGLADDSVLTLTETPDGAVFAGTANGFSRLRGDDIESFRAQDGLSQSTVYSVYQDREGTLWVATKHGLNQFLDGRAIPYTTSEGLPSNATGPVLQDRSGAMWIGTLARGLARFDGHRFTTITRRDGLPSDVVRALAEDPSGDLWVGTDAGLTRLHRGQVAGVWTMQQGLPANDVRALFVDRSGSLWIATTTGSAVLRGGRVRRAAPGRRDGAEPILAFAEDDRRGVFGAPSSDAPELRHADALYEDRDGLLWVGTLGDGVRLVDGDRVVTFSVADGLFDDVVYGIAEDDHGRLWMACSKGIFSVNRSDLRQFAAGAIDRFVSTPYSPLDGLRTIECRSGVQPAIARAGNGQLWFATIRGVLVIDPDRIERRFAPPAAALEDVTVDGERRSADDLGELPAGRNTLAFGYTGLSFVSPTRITFRYKLDGFDTDWVDAGPRREAFYTNLPPGHFRFHVAACNLDGACNVAPAAVAFVIAPRYFQRAWFLPLILFAAAVVVWATYRIRIRRLSQRFDLILAERSRIARELHDTVIQGFAGVTMAMQALASRLPLSVERRTLEDIVTDAGQSLREARQTLAGLRRDQPQAGLSAALERTARQLTASKGVRLKLTLDPARGELPADVEYNLLRIAQEAVSNALAHADARTVHVSLDRSAERLRLSVRDDGAGFQPVDAAPDGHYGLIGMKERAAQIGADFQLTSAPGRGTIVSVTVAA